MSDLESDSESILVPIPVPIRISTRPPVLSGLEADILVD